MAKTTIIKLHFDTRSNTNLVLLRKRKRFVVLIYIYKYAFPAQSIFGTLRIVTACMCH